MELWVCERDRKERRDRELSPAGIVVAVMVSSTIPTPLLRMAMTVMEYSVPSSRPISLYIVSPVVRVIESLKQSVLLFE